MMTQGKIAVRTVIPQLADNKTSFKNFSTLWQTGYSNGTLALILSRAIFLSDIFSVLFYMNLREEFSIYLPSTKCLLGSSFKCTSR